MSICKIMAAMQRALDCTRSIDFLAPLAMCFYIAPVMWMDANTKWNPLDANSSLESTIQWFDNADGEDGSSCAGSTLAKRLVCDC